MKKCEYCGKEFEPKRREQRFCSRSCVAKSCRPKTIKKCEKCEYCGKEFEPKRREQRFCSRSCVAKSCRPKTIKKCEYCGKEFNPHRLAGKYCSRVCAGKATRDTQRKLKRAIKKCARCGKEFEGIQSQKYCSSTCRQLAHYNYQPVRRTCPVCGKQFNTKKHRSAVYCSDYCRDYRAYELKTCAHCGSQFLPEFEGDKFCCAACRLNYYSQERQEAFVKVLGR